MLLLLSECYCTLISLHCSLQSSGLGKRHECASRPVAMPHPGLRVVEDRSSSVLSRTEKVSGTRVCEPGEAAVTSSQSLVDSPSRGASVPA